MERRIFIDSRKFPRIEVNFTIDSEINEEFEKKFRLASEKIFKAAAKDISEGGIGVLTKYFLPTGLILNLEIDGAPFGLETKIKTKGDVRYCLFVKNLGYRCGIKFLDIAEGDRKAIATFIAAHDRRSSPRT